jgi:hypothetical protein
MEPRPTCQSHTPLNCSRRSPTRACDTTHSTSTVTIHHWWPPPHKEWSLAVHALPAEGLVSHFLLPHTVPPLLCFALLRAGFAHHGQPPLSRSRRRLSWGKGSPSPPLPLAASWSSSCRPYVGRASSPHCVLLLHGWPSTTTVRAPPTLPPLQEEPLESIVWPRLHLHRRRPLVRVVTVVHSSSSSLTATRPLWWAPIHPTTTHRFP